MAVHFNFPLESTMATTEVGRKEFFFRHFSNDMGITVDETIGGLALIVLSILALAQIDPETLNAVATIVAAVALIVISAGLSAALNRAASGTPGIRTLGTNDMTSGLSGGVLGGVVAIVLGILALIGIAPATLIAVALVVFGGAVLIDFVASVQMRSLGMLSSDSPPGSVALAVSAASISNTASIAVAVALVVLGILGLVGAGGAALSAVALLTLGAYLFLEGSAVVARMMLWMTP
jgi:hypothetical protein